MNKTNEKWHFMSKILQLHYKFGFHGEFKEIFLTDPTLKNGGIYSWQLKSQIIIKDK